MRIALVDDVEEELEQLQGLLAFYREEHPLSFSVECFQSSEDFLAMFQPGRYSIVFMDIYMKGMPGTEAAGAVRRADPDCIIIFLTSSDGFMPQAFSCHAFDYIQKPPRRERIFQVMADATRILPQEYKALSFVFNRRSVRLLYSDIICTVSSGHNTDITARGGTVYSPHITFSELTAPLAEDARFLQINRGILVNMDYILNFDNRTCRLSGDIALPVRIREQQQIQESWQDYVFAKLHTRLRKGDVNRVLH